MIGVKGDGGGKEISYFFMKFSSNFVNFFSNFFRLSRRFLKFNDFFVNNCMSLNKMTVGAAVDEMIRRQIVEMRRVNR